MPGSQSVAERGASEFFVDGIFFGAAEAEAKVDEGNIQEVESSLRERLSLNLEEARALLGRLEYQRGNLEAALRVFDGIDLHSAVDRLQSPPVEKSPRKGRPGVDSVSRGSQRTASLVLEAIYLKAKSLQKLGRFTEAAEECKNVLDAVERIFQHGISEALVDTKLQEIVSQAVELLPEIWRHAGSSHEAITAYRRALLSHWKLENEHRARIQKNFALFLLYSGAEAAPPSLSVQIERASVPRNNLEEAILLLMILLRNCFLGKIMWDPSVLEHLTFALSICSQTAVLAMHLEEILPGVLDCVDLWNTLALCYSTAGEDESAVSLLRKSLHKHERPDEIMPLLLAAKICSKNHLDAAEGLKYAERAVSISEGRDGHLKGVGLHMMGRCLRKQAEISSSHFERSHLQSEALKLLERSIIFECHNPDLLYELGGLNAEQRNLHAALHYVKQFIDTTGGSVLEGWRLLALVLSAQQRFSEAEAVIDAALDETVRWDQGPLFRIKAKLSLVQSLPTDAIEAYRHLLALVQAQRRSCQPLKPHKFEDEIVNEFEVWHCLATMYSSLSRWKDAEICLEKAKTLKQNSGDVLQTKGLMCESRGLVKEALAAYIDAVMLEPDSVSSKICLGSLLAKISSKTLPVARGLLLDALRIDPTNHKAWYCLGLIHKSNGRIDVATECFQAASMLEDSNPIESFSKML